MRLRLSERRLVAWEDSLGSVFLLANPSVRLFLCPMPQGCLNIQVKKCAALVLYSSACCATISPEHFTLYTRGEGERKEQTHLCTR